MMLGEYPDVLTVGEACEVLRIGYNAIYVLLNSGKLKGYRNGRVWRIPKRSIQEYILSSAGLDKNKAKLTSALFVSFAFLCAF